MKIHQKLVEKLAQKKELYEKITDFSNTLPMFEEEIISRELTGDSYCEIVDSFKELHLSWGVNWYPRTPTNYPKDKSHQLGFVHVYINCMDLFNSYSYSFTRGELSKIIPSIKVHFYDELNTTFYFLPSEISDGLEKLNDWYLLTKRKVNAYQNKAKKENLERQLLALQ